MGYQTRYQLSYDRKNRSVTEHLEETTYSGYNLLHLDGEPVKWYDHHVDMLSLSEKFQDVLFTLDGEGEDSGDIWRAYYLNGKGYKEYAKIIFEDFDIGKLNNV